MNETKNNVSTMYQSIPAVAALNHVPGFEPSKLLRRTKSRKTNEEVLKLPLPYKKLWFRLANPKGRIRLNALTITEQMAIYEAQVYLDRSDAQPVSSFTARCNKKEATVEDYIRAAQEEAMDEALSLAGFGLQFADVGMTADALRYGSEIPLTAVSTVKNHGTVSSASEGSNPQRAISQNQAEMPVRQPARQAPTPVNRQAATSVVQPTVNASKPAEIPAAPAGKTIASVTNTDSSAKQMPQAQAPMPHTTVQMPASVAAATPEKEHEKLPVPETHAAESLPVAPVAAQTPENIVEEADTLPIPGPGGGKLPVAEQSAASKEPTKQDAPAMLKGASAAQKAVQILQMHAVAKESGNAATSTMEETAAQIPQPASEAIPKYTQNMPVEDIIKLMTYEEAKNVVVDTGSCNGWTIEEVSQRRPPSLKFYVYGGYKGENNILRAAAQIMLDHLGARKAG